MKHGRLLLCLLIPVLFLVVSIATLPDYGFNWDEPFHFMRGQAYLHYFLTGRADYRDLAAYPILNSDCPPGYGKCSGLVSPKGPADFDKSITGKTYEQAVWDQNPQLKLRRSFFQNDNYTFSDFVKNDEGHPPLNGILASLSNYIFYQRLHWLGDLEAYHLFEVLASFSLVVEVAVFVWLQFGVMASMVASLSLSVYPLFFGESHFNVKDPPLAAFFGLATILFYFGVTRNKWWLVVGSAVAAGLALGTKFNIFFWPVIVGPWLIMYLVRGLRSGRFKLSRLNRVWKLILSLIAFGPIMFGLFFATWPFLWSNPLPNFWKIFRYYEQIGIGTPGEMAHYIHFGWNTYPLIWIIDTTPLPILALTTLGLIYSLYRLVRKHDDVSLLLVLWLVVPIVRVSWPNASLYGGVRQIMEYIPALAIMAGIGAFWILEAARKRANDLTRVLVATLIVLSLLGVVGEMIKIHPNENVYLNQLVGGLAGAKERQLPYWGNSYGNVYLQGVKWLNAHSELNARVGLPISTLANLPKLKLRSDIAMGNFYWSGTSRAGEYEMEMTHDWALKDWYTFSYLETYLEPVYQVKVDGVPILKIWKNDLAHTRAGFEREKEYPAKTKIEDDQFRIDLGKEIRLTGINIAHGSQNCSKVGGGYIATSLDSRDWARELDPITEAQVPLTINAYTKNNFIFLFPAKTARYISLNPLDGKSCLFEEPQITVTGLAEDE